MGGTFRKDTRHNEVYNLQNAAGMSIRLLLKFMSEFKLEIQI